MFVLLLAAMACAQTAAATAGERPVLGAEVDLVAVPASERSQLLDRLAAAGVSSIRMPLDWNRVEPKRGSFEWGEAEAAVDLARARGMEVVLILGPCAVWAVDPAWEVPEAQRARSIPKESEDWRDYVTAAVSHFRGRVSYWQVRRQPNSRNFRGARSEYEELLEVASKAARAADPAARIIVPESGHLTVAAIAEEAGAAERPFDVMGVYPPADPGESMLPWSVIFGEVLGGMEAAERPEIWVLGGGDEPRSAEAWRVHYLAAWAFGVERCYLPPEAIDPDWYGQLAGWKYEGFAVPEKGVWSFVFETPAGRVACAWGEPSAVSREQTAELVMHAVDGQEISSPEASAPEAGAPARADVMRARGGLDLSQVPLVYVDCSLPELPEFGLYNRCMRGMGGGAVCEVNQGRGACIQTKMSFGSDPDAPDNPWLYFDVDDSWLYYNRDDTRLAITVECEGAYLGDEKLGLNIYYDTKEGYRFTDWQWVDKGYGRHVYRFVVNDASFANRDGYDFRINAKGSKQDLSVFSVAVEKLPPPPGPAYPGAAVAEAGSAVEAAPAAAPEEARGPEE